MIIAFSIILISKDARMVFVPPMFIEGYVGKGNWFANQDLNHDIKRCTLSLHCPEHVEGSKGAYYSYPSSFDWLRMT
jgi:hypothetical protein